MKKITAMLFALLLLLSAAAVAEESRTLVVYMSRAGENYNVGVTRTGSASAAYAGYIEKGNTAIMAELIAEELGADLYPIVPAVAYPEDYATMLRVAQDELDTDARPEIAGELPDMSAYDTVFIGYPVWHGAMPQIIYTFMESVDLSGKTVIPFNTHEGSGSVSVSAIRNALPDSTVTDGIAIRGKRVQEETEAAREDIRSWLTREGLGAK